MKFPHKFSAFTLIELLVVISIIAILAALAIPSLTGALKRGQSSACLSNLRQIGVATIGYAADNDMVLPPAGSGGTPEWAVKIASYTGVDSKKNKSIFVCPGCEIKVDSAASGEVAVTYGMHGGLMPKGGEPMALDSVKNASSLILCADMCQNPGNKGWSPYSIEKPADFTKISSTTTTDTAIAPGVDKDTGNNASMRYRHNGYANVVMADGSARSFKKGTVMTGNATMQQ
ncbi:MAG: hypothetical protein RIQ71_695 [Verrucomicrobiota bacterium]|jgi:prepilin-type N-terminal cleavage/methylation domain-containing protein/prepilin-type processing-associated H-X9-DG protein